MNPFYCNLSFRVFHPTFSADDICHKLKYKAYRKWTVGENKISIKGKPLAGIYNNTYCLFYFKCHNPTSLEHWIEEALRKLRKHRAYLKTLTETKGHLELFVTAYFDQNSGMIFDWRLLSQLSDLNITVILDLFPQNGNYHYDKLEESFYKMEW